MNTLVEDLRKTMDWTKFDPPGGVKHYEGLKTAFLPLLGELIGDLEKQKAEFEGKLKRWEVIAQKAAQLDEVFNGLVESQDFMNMIRDFDFKSLLELPRPGWISIGNWIEVGRAITRTLNAGSHQYDSLKARVTGCAREVASAIALRNLMGGFVTVCEIEFVLRHAPIRFRTRIFRDLVRELNAVTAAGETLNFKFVPDYLARFEEGAEKIKTEVRRMKWICKLLRKEIERHGETFWTGLEAWMAAKVSAA